MLRPAAKHSLTAWAIFSCSARVSCGYIGNERIAGATLLSYREVSSVVAEGAIRLLQVKRDWVVDARTDARSLQIVL